MPDLFKHIREAFNKPSVRKEDWLDPSDRVLENIQAEINRDNKKDRSILFYLIPLSLFLIGVSFLLFFNVQNEVLRVEKTNLLLENAEIFSHKETIKIDVVEIPSIMESEKTVESIKVQEKYNEKQNLNRKNTIKFIKGSNIIGASKQSNKADSKPDFLSYTNSVVDKSLSLDNNDKNIIYQANHSVEESSEAHIEIPYDIINHSVYPQKPIEKISLLDIEKVSTSVIKTTMPTVTEINFNVEKNELVNPFFIEAGIGFALWEFKLNEEYENLVEPAAFEDSNGVGYSGSLKIGKKINSRFGLSLNIDYTRVQFTSGHNSVLTFDNSLNQQSHSLLMATPLGFVNSDVALFRMAGSNMGETDLMVELDNEHQIEAVEISFAANLKIVNSDQIGLSVFPGVGLQQVIASKNQHVNLETNNFDFNSNGQIIESEFNDLNKFSPTATLGLLLSKRLGNNWQIGLNLKGSVNLRPIQESGDLSTKVNRYGVGLKLRKNF